jgi:hypothetical protein
MRQECANKCPNTKRCSKIIWKHSRFYRRYDLETRNCFLFNISRNCGLILNYLNVKILYSRRLHPNAIFVAFKDKTNCNSIMDTVSARRPTRQIVECSTFSAANHSPSARYIIAENDVQIFGHFWKKISFENSSSTQQYLWTDSLFFSLILFYFLCNIYISLSTPLIFAVDK